MKAIDLYSGIGGWALGLELAGIAVCESYEWWKSAAETEKHNLGKQVTIQDIRTLDPSLLPVDIDVVVGSPPCTQFSYSNRGGSGDIDEGLKDIEKFLEVVEYIKPKFWAMENVPRVARLLSEHLAPRGYLHRFHNLAQTMEIRILDTSKFGLPQRRRRCIAGNLPFDLLEKYAALCKKIDLGKALRAMERDPVLDVNFGFVISRKELSETEKEPFLDQEEERINREAKSYHPVYNDMAFPDSIDRPVRTVAATCTRVSRESIVIEDLSIKGSYRRLTVRERGMLQGFPITYEFYGKNYSEKLKMIGNAIPPVLTYYIGLAMLRTDPRNVKLLCDRKVIHLQPETRPLPTPPDQIGHSYPVNRRFRFAIPNLRFKSGTRFDLANVIEDGSVIWRVKCFFGSSKDIKTIRLDQSVYRKAVEGQPFCDIKSDLTPMLDDIHRRISAYDIAAVQDRWADKMANGPHPFELLDDLGRSAEELIESPISKREQQAISFIQGLVSDYYPEQDLASLRKLEKFAIPMFCGILVGSIFNTVMVSAD